MTYHDPDAWPPPRMPRHARPNRRRRRRPRQSATPGLRGTIPWVIGLCTVVAAVMVVAEVSPPSRTRGDSASTEKLSVTQNLAGQPSSPASRTPSSASNAARSDGLGGGSQPPKAQRGGRLTGDDAAPWHWQVIADFSGTGDLTTAAFRVRQRNLRLRWTFRCPSATEPGSFDIQDVTAISTSVDGSIEATGTAGRGTAVVYPGGADNFLVVTSSCTWAVKAVQRS